MRRLLVRRGWLPPDEAEALRDTIAQLRFQIRVLTGTHKPFH